MSSRSDTESLRWIAQLDAALSENAAWMAGVADAVERLGFDRQAACGPADLLPGLAILVEDREAARIEIERLHDVVAALNAEVERWQSECVDCRADLAREVGRSHGMARWGCPSCPPGDDQEVVGDLGLVCLRCGTRYYDGHEETS